MSLTGLLLTSCAGSQARAVDADGIPLDSPPIPTESNSAVLFFYRPASFFASGVYPTVVLDNPPLCISKIQNGAYTWITVPPGRHHFKVWTAQDQGKDNQIPTEVSAVGGGRYYFRVTPTGNMNVPGWSSRGPYFGAERTDSAEAKKELKDTYYVHPWETCEY
jgi:hypothetical protein